MPEKLSEQDKAFIAQMDKWEKNVSLNYISMGLIFCLAILGLVIGVLTNSKDGYLMAVYFTTIGGLVLVATKYYRKFIAIIKKLM
jgi:hypothetical protein